MNMRWGWTLPVLTALATVLPTGRAWSQGGAASPPATSGGPTTAAAAMPANAPQPAAAYGQYAVPMMYAPPPGYPAAMYAPPPGYPAGMYAPPGMYPQGVQQAAYMPTPATVGMQAPGPFPAGPTPDVYGSYGSMPSEYGAQGGGQPGYGPPGYGPEGYGGPGGQGMYDPSAMYGGGGQMGGPMGGGGMGGPCQYCGGQGCEQCGPGYGNGGHGSFLPNGLIGDCLGLIAPYPDGGCAAPRWYDFAVDWMMLKRDNTGRNQNISSVGIAGPIALNTNDLDFGGYKPAFRFSAAFQLAAANSLEFTYFGQANYTSHAIVRSGNANLFSTFSNFGTQPLGGIVGFDAADFQRIDYQSTFDSFEVNWRRRWMAPNCRYQGSWTLGVRHFILDEKFMFGATSSANSIPVPNLPNGLPARGVSETDTTNNLTGIQLGGDTWICILPGFRVGGEFQAGVYGNHMNINTNIYTNQGGVLFNEQLQANDVSFIGQANLLATYRINYQWSARAGYQFIYVDGVALAGENYDGTAPLINNPINPRVRQTNDNGNMFLHGWNVGLEYMW